MPRQIKMLAETASQTAGPYVHIGLAPQQAGFDIFEKNFDNVLGGLVLLVARVRVASSGICVPPGR